jgi:uncharacterized membrane protein
MGMSKNTYKNLIVLIFVLIALPTGVLLAVLTPPGQVPDEQAQVARALGLLHGAVLAVRKPVIDSFTHQPVMRTGVKVDLGLLQAAASPVTMINGNPVITTGDFVAANAGPTNHAKVFADIPNTAGSFPLTYLPATAGLAIGLAADAPPATCFLMARLCMLAAFLVLGGLALWLTAFGEAVLLTILLLPMSLYLAGSVHQGGVVIALTCLVCALLSRGSRKAWLAALGLFLAVLLAKIFYALLLVVFLLPVSRAGVRLKLRDLGIACVPLLLWGGIVAAFVTVNYPVPLYHPGPLYHGDAGIWLDHAWPAVNLHILLGDPVRLVSLPWRTEHIWFFGLAKEMVGVLGLVHIELPMKYYFLWAGCGVAAVSGLLFCPRPVVFSQRTALTNFAVTAAAILLTYWLIMLVFYVDFTNAGWDSVTGLQGQFFLPLLPFLLFALPGLRGRFKLSPIIPALPAMLLGLYDVGYLPLTIVKNYYLH